MFLPGLGILNGETAVFIYSSFSVSGVDRKGHDSDTMSVWPAVAAASFGWLVALGRLFVGHGRGENLDVDLVLAGGAVLLIPSICAVFLLNARRARRVRRRAQPEVRPG